MFLFLQKQRPFSRGIVSPPPRPPERGQQCSPSVVPGPEEASASAGNVLQMPVLGPPPPGSTESEIQRVGLSHLCPKEAPSDSGCTRKFEKQRSWESSQLSSLFCDLKACPRRSMILFSCDFVPSSVGLILEKAVKITTAIHSIIRRYKAMFLWRIPGRLSQRAVWDLCDGKGTMDLKLAPFPLM